METVRMVHFEKLEAVGIIKIDRPGAMNALNEQVLLELDEVIKLADADRDVSVIIITGEGRAFVAGADIASMQHLDSEAGYDLAHIGQTVFRKIEMLDKPVIAAINGFALGGGCELAMACDIRIASTKAKLGQPEVGLGITPGFSGTLRLPRIVGKAKAIELICTGDIIDSEEAAAIGLVNKVVPQDCLMDAAIALANKISKNAPLAVMYSKKAINEGLEETDLDKAIDIEAVYFSKCFDTNDQKEGMEAFLEKRRPTFKGE